jgi:septum formation protein
LLAGLGAAYTVYKPEIDETPQPGEAPLAYVARLALEKACAAAAHAKDGELVLAADTVVILAADTIGVDERGEILGKPADAAEARAMLRALRGRDHLVVTAFVLLPLNGAPPFQQLVKTVVTMRDYTDEEIEAYIATGDPFDKAGSYAIQHPQFRPVAAVKGSLTNVIGLPIDEVRAALVQFGVLDAADG